MLSANETDLEVVTLAKAKKLHRHRENLQEGFETM